MKPSAADVEAKNQNPAHIIYLDKNKFPDLQKVVYGARSFYEYLSSQGYSHLVHVPDDGISEPRVKYISIDKDKHALLFLGEPLNEAEEAFQRFQQFQGKQAESILDIILKLKLNPYENPVLFSVAIAAIVSSGTFVAGAGLGVATVTGTTSGVILYTLFKNPSKNPPEAAQHPQAIPPSPNDGGLVPHHAASPPGGALLISPSSSPIVSPLAPPSP